MFTSHIITTVKPDSLSGPSIDAAEIWVLMLFITLPRNTLKTKTPKNNQKNASIFPRPDAGTCNRS